MREVDMKVLHLSTPRIWRGGEQQLECLYKGLAKQNIEQLIACPEASGLYERAVARGYAVDVIPNNFIVGFFAAFKLSKIYNKFLPDIIHCHDARAHSLAILFARFSRKPVNIIVSRRVDFPVKSGFWSQRKYASKYVKKYICVSSAIMEILSRAVARSRCCVVHDGIDLAKFSQPPQGKLYDLVKKDSSVFIIGCVAALADHKDYFTFLKAIKIVSSSANVPIVVTIFGEGDLLRDLQQEVAKLHLEQVVMFLGRRDDLPELLPDFNIFLLASKTEGLCQSLLEAMSARVPIVATNAGGIPEIVQHNVTGLLASVGDYSQLATLTQELIASPDRRKLLVENAAKQVQNFSYQSMSQQTYDVYCQCINDN
jgi:L-malate glycosyltransferase